MACAAALSPPSAAGLLGTAGALLCAAGEAGSMPSPPLCAPLVAKALHRGGLLSLSALAPALNASAACAALQPTGCCGAAALAAAHAAAAATCHSALAAQLSALAASCALPPACPSFQPPNLPKPPNNCTPFWLPPAHHCADIAAASCPATACQLLCAIGALDPPPAAPQPPTGVGMKGPQAHRTGGGVGEHGKVVNRAAATARAHLAARANAFCSALTFGLAGGMLLTRYLYRRRGVAVAASREEGAAEAVERALPGACVGAALVAAACDACFAPDYGLCVRGPGSAHFRLPLLARTAAVALGYAAWGLYLLACARIAAAQAAGPPLLQGAVPAALVTEGPYALSRHPQRLGVTAFLGAFVLASGAGLALPPLALLAALQWRGVAAEEAELAAAHGAKWGAYAARTPLVPGWRGGAVSAPPPTPAGHLAALGLRVGSRGQLV